MLSRQPHAGKDTIGAPGLTLGTNLLYQWQSRAGMDATHAWGLTLGTNLLSWQSRAGKGATHARGLTLGTNLLYHGNHAQGWEQPVRGGIGAGELALDYNARTQMAPG